MQRAGRTLCVQAGWAAWCSLPRLPTTRFPTCSVIRVADYSVVWDCNFTSIFFPKSIKRSTAAISRPQRSFITFHGALRNILLSAGLPATVHMITSEQKFVNNPLRKIISCWRRFWIDSTQALFYILPCWQQAHKVTSIFVQKNFKFLRFSLGKNESCIYICVHRMSLNKAREKLNLLTKHNRGHNARSVMQDIKVFSLLCGPFYMFSLHYSRRI